MNKIKKDEHVNTYIDGVLLVEKGHDDHWTTSTKFIISYQNTITY